MDAELRAVCTADDSVKQMSVAARLSQPGVCSQRTEAVDSVDRATRLRHIPRGIPRAQISPSGLPKHDHSVCTASFSTVWPSGRGVVSKSTSVSVVSGLAAAGNRDHHRVVETVAHGVHGTPGIDLENHCTFSENWVSTSQTTQPAINSTLAKRPTHWRQMAAEERDRRMVGSEAASDEALARRLQEEADADAQKAIASDFGGNRHCARTVGPATGEIATGQMRVALSQPLFPHRVGVAYGGAVHPGTSGFLAPTVPSRTNDTHTVIPTTTSPVSSGLLRAESGFSDVELAEALEASLRDAERMNPQTQPAFPVASHSFMDVPRTTGPGLAGLAPSSPSAASDYEFQQAMRASLVEEITFAAPAAESEVVGRQTFTMVYEAESAPADEEHRCCAVCCEAFLLGDCVRVLPCLHRYHVACVDRWLAQTRTCPVCKHEVAD
eukprot:TRINITY_DN74462_c0_g1_i1.p1 TRINITY_DN74462_c0_g1~~TRINITY_DN74462_c0_g1_i1.p1  ORF type:complete len:488 (-),score=53.39 TRINITY_DN74462_c0_g1_i1:151-1467(-)